MGKTSYKAKTQLGEFKITTLKNLLINNQAVISMRNFTTTLAYLKYQPTVKPLLQYLIELDLISDFFALYKSPICN